MDMLDGVIHKLHKELMIRVTPVDMIESLFSVVLVHRKPLDDLVPMKQLNIPQNEGRNPIGICPKMELNMAICQLNPLFRKALILILALGH